MSKSDNIVEMVAAGRHRFGHVDEVVNTAGIQHVEAIETFPPAKWDAIITVAAKHGVLGLTKTVLTPLVEKQIPRRAS